MFGTLKKKLGASSKNLASKKNPENPDLFSPFYHNGLGELKNRIALAPMTRSRATEDGVVGEAQALYYSQRADCGLLITEGTQISPQAVGWWHAPRIYEDKHIKAWTGVVQAVHETGGKIVCQLWHLGRQSHSDFQPGNALPVAASAIAVQGDAHVPGGKAKPYEVPRALETNEVPALIKDFVKAAKNAMKAGFDGVEIHNANGYILDTFLQSCSNTRTDKYGGSLENRTRLLSELLTAMIKEVPREKIGIRFSPNGVYGSMGSADNIETFTAAIEICAKNKIGYVHIMDGLGFGFHNKCEAFTLERARNIIEGVQGKGKSTTLLIGNCGHTKEDGEKLVKAKHGDLIAYGRPYIYNPDLVDRFREGIELASENGIDAWYGPKENTTVGYTDFPRAEKKQ